LPVREQAANASAPDDGIFGEGGALTVQWTGTAMAERNRFELDILCPNCGAHGEALVSENGDPDMPRPGFRVDRYPHGFSEEKPSVRRHDTTVQCKCGQVFCLS
jgi:hypothetical protein